MDFVKLTESLLPCPFCGCKACLDVQDDKHGHPASFSLGCTDDLCIAANINFTEPMRCLEATVREWNKRADISKWLPRDINSQG